MSEQLIKVGFDRWQAMTVKELFDNRPDIRDACINGDMVAITWLASMTGFRRSWLVERFKAWEA